MKRCGHLVVSTALAVLAGGAHAALPSGISSQDIGSVGQAGSANYNGGLYTMTGAGADISGTSDAFRFLYGNFSGDGEVTAHIDSVTEPNADTRVGVMIRDSLNANGANAFMFVHPSKGSAFQVRAASGASTTTTWQGAPFQDDSWDPPSPYRARYLRPDKWIKLTRAGNVLSAYSSDDGSCWNIRASATFSSAPNFAGIALTSHSTATLANASISNFTIRMGTPGPVNASCRRAQVDGDIAPPPATAAAWKVGIGDPWEISTSDPDPDQRRPVSCREGGELDHRRYRDDDPICPTDTLTAAWANRNYGYNTGAWQWGKAGPFGDSNKGPVATPLTNSQLWMRKEINLSSSELSQVVFWGRWSNSVSIYVNGVLATNTYNSGLSNRFHYLGMNSRARAALVAGNNVIAVRLDCTKDCSGPVYGAFGVALHPKLGNYPRNVNVTTPGSNYAGMAQVFEDHTQEMGALGGTFAVRVADTLVESRSLGFKDISLNASVPADPIMRLASVDKRITEAVIVKLYREGKLNPDARVFGNGGVLANVLPLGGTWGANVQNITVDQLRLHTSGISQIGGAQSYQDEIAFRFGTSANKLTKHHLASVLAAQNTESAPGAEYHYNSNGYFLLRYIAETLDPGKTLKDYINEMDDYAQSIVIASERLEGRPANEGGYLIAGKETRARWFELEEYLALSASAKGLTKFFNKYAAAYERRGNDFVEVNGGQGGAMDGTRSAGGSNPTSDKVAKVQIWNSDLAGNGRFDDRMESLVWGLNPGSCDPRTQPNQRFRINSAWTGERYVNVETSLQAGPIYHYWESAKWKFVPVAGTSYYIIQNAWDLNQALQASNGVVTSGAWDPASPSAHWKLEDHGTYFRIESRAMPGAFLNIESGPLAVNYYDDGMHSTRWYLCN